MKFGVFTFPTDTSIGVVELGRAVEERGFESLFLPEHSHIPVSRATPFPGGGDLPEEYHRTLDPFVALGAVAGATTTLKLGLGICLVVQRDPIHLAKEVATLDLISGGRTIFGIGAGWNIEEMSNHGTDPKTRFALVRERIEAMKAIWTQEEAEYHGKFVDFDPIWQWPKPVQRPHPPIMIGGYGPKALHRVVDYADEWLPTAWRDPAELGERVRELQKLAAEAGRGPIPVSMFGTAPDPAVIEQFVSFGVHRCIFTVPTGDRDAALQALDTQAKIAEQFA